MLVAQCNRPQPSAMYVANRDTQRLRWALAIGRWGCKTRLAWRGWLACFNVLGRVRQNVIELGWFGELFWLCVFVRRHCIVGCFMRFGLAGPVRWWFGGRMGRVGWFKYVRVADFERSVLISGFVVGLSNFERTLSCGGAGCYGMLRFAL
ncbi:hypothetical protein BT63DRAFT_164350 [Microthyrium microscopicum]|uniref:Uncharacterized protein n=1 Tax=Microthyrium microscopicum TaxID=703497 RepID=A0A6A6UQH4_9PEZI|nr:hypothetical protein BT63DRAFT_164350 [Microthyrium microscopicum]